jgi:hypothetical protein
MVWLPLAPLLETVISHRPDFRLGMSEVAATAAPAVTRSVITKAKCFMAVS